MEQGFRGYKLGSALPTGSSWSSGEMHTVEGEGRAKEPREEGV